MEAAQSTPPGRYASPAVAVPPLVPAPVKLGPSGGTPCGPVPGSGLNEYHPKVTEMFVMAYRNGSSSVIANDVELPGDEAGSERVVTSSPPVAPGRGGGAAGV